MSNSPIESVGTSRRWSVYARYATWLIAAFFAVRHFLTEGFNLYSVAIFAFVVLLAFAAQFVEIHSRRPLKNYLRVALVAALLGLALIAMPLLMGVALWIGLLLWVGIVGTLLTWCIFYERTEPVAKD